MATLWAHFGKPSDFSPNVIKLLGKSKVTLAGGDVSLAAAPAGTTVAMLVTDAAAYFELGATASATSYAIPSGVPLWVQCGEGLVIHGFT